MLPFIETFHQRMKVLLTDLAIDFPEEKRQEVYSIKIEDNGEIFIFCDPAGYLNLRCEIGKLPDVATETLLLNLLHLNTFLPIGLCLNVGASPETRCVELWLRQKIVEISDQEIKSIFDLATRLIETIQNLLKGEGMAATPHWQSI
jgi:hypothetical protein